MSQKSDIGIRSSSSRHLERAIANRNRTKIGVGSSICGMMGVLRNENGSSVPQSFGKTMSSNGEDHCRNTDVVERSSSVRRFQRARIRPFHGTEFIVPQKRPTVPQWERPWKSFREK